MRNRIYVEDPFTHERITLTECARRVGCCVETISTRHREGKRGFDLFLKPASPEAMEARKRNLRRAARASRRKPGDGPTPNERREMADHVLQMRSNLLLSRKLDKHIAK